MEDLDRAAELAEGRECAPEVEGDLPAETGIDRRGRPPAGAVEVIALAVGRLGEAELVQNGPALGCAGGSSSARRR